MEHSRERETPSRTRTKRVVQGEKRDSETLKARNSLSTCKVGEDRAHQERVFKDQGKLLTRGEGVKTRGEECFTNRGKTARQIT